MTTRVNCITTFINNFRRNGRTANSIIYQADCNPVLQRVRKDGSIALQTSYSDSDVFTLITDENIIEKVINITKTGNSKRWQSAKTYWKNTGKLFNKEKIKLKEKLFVNGTLEEDATKISLSNGSVSYVVHSSAGRTTEFPQTAIAKKMHPAVMEKYEHLDGIEGRKTYIEHHPFI